MHAPVITDGGRPTQEERRAATRAGVVAAAVETLAEHGHGALTTRAVAQRAGVSQATVMHHFGTRSALLTEAMGTLCRSIVDEVEALSSGIPQGAPDGPGMLDHLWERMRGPGGLAIGQAWCAAWSDDELTPVIAEFDRAHVEALFVAMRRVHPPDVDLDRLAAYVELALATMKGVLLLAAVVSPSELDARWASVRPLLVRAGAEFADHPDRA